MKYGNRKVVIDGIQFDSAKESRRYCELKLLQRAGKIQELQLQKEFELLPSQKIDGKVVERAVKYKADFYYLQDGRVVVEDTKGFRTKDYIIKRKLLLWRFGIRIIEI